MFLLKVLLLGLLAPTLGRDGKAIEPHFDRSNGRLVGGENLLKGRVLAVCVLRLGMRTPEWMPLLKNGGLAGGTFGYLGQTSYFYPAYQLRVYTFRDGTLHEVEFVTPPDAALEMEVAFEDGELTRAPAMRRKLPFLKFAVVFPEASR